MEEPGRARIYKDTKSGHVYDNQQCRSRMLEVFLDSMGLQRVGLT